MTDHKITEMPDKQTLEAFLDSSSSRVKVYFDLETGTFKWADINDKEKEE